MVPVIVTGTAVPRAPEFGAIPVSAGPTTVNVTAVLVPAGVVAVTFLALRVAPVVMVKFAVTVVSFTTVTPEPDTVTAVVPVRWVPVRVTGTVVPRAPEAGEIAVRVAPCTVNATVLLVRPSAVTLTFL